MLFAFRPSNEPRLRRIEAKLDALIQHLGIELPEEMVHGGLSKRVRQLADGGQKIDAIKLHREETGAGLKDAKDAVEAYLE